MAILVCSMKVRGRRVKPTNAPSRYGEGSPIAFAFDAVLVGGRGAENVCGELHPQRVASRV